MAGLPKPVAEIELGSAVVVRPGDKLVIARPDRLSYALADEIKTRLGERLPGVEVVLIDLCSGLAVYRDETKVAGDPPSWLTDEPVTFKRAGVTPVEHTVLGQTPVTS